jgi:hypothetical protein
MTQAYLIYGLRLAYSYYLLGISNVLVFSCLDLVPCLYSYDLRGDGSRYVSLTPKSNVEIGFITS